MFNQGELFLTGLLSGSGRFLPRYSHGTTDVAEDKKAQAHTMCAFWFEPLLEDGFLSGEVWDNARHNLSS